MEQLERFMILGKENEVFKLVKLLYDRKQTPKQWHEKNDNAMISNGFEIMSNKYIYIKQAETSYTVLYSYVDYILIMRSDKKIIKSTKDMLNSKFDVKDLVLLM